MAASILLDIVKAQAFVRQCIAASRDDRSPGWSNLSRMCHGNRVPVSGFHSITTATASLPPTTLPTCDCVAPSFRRVAFWHLHLSREREANAQSSATRRRLFHLQRQASNVVTRPHVQFPAFTSHQSSLAPPTLRQALCKILAASPTHPPPLSNCHPLLTDPSAPTLNAGKPLCRTRSRTSIQSPAANAHPSRVRTYFQLLCALAKSNDRRHVGLPAACGAQPQPISQPV